MITRALTGSGITAPDGTLLEGTLQFEPARRDGVCVDADGVVAGTTTYTITAGAFSGNVQAPCVYWARFYDASGNLINNPRTLASVDDDDTGGVTIQTMLGTNAPVFSAKNNWAGSSPPTSADDVDSGYSEGSLWYDNSKGTGNVVYVCRDNSSRAAVWVQLGAQY